MLTDRIVIVTGAARGIGRQHCLELARHGATVIVNDLEAPAGSDTPGAAAVAAEIVASGGKATSYDCSVTDYGAVRELVGDTINTYGRVDAVVNNAGITRDRMMTSMDEEQFDVVVATHLKGTWALTKFAAEHWRERSKHGDRVTGRVINTTSGTGLFGNVGQSNYGAAKAGIANLTIITAMELARYGVTANAISPLARTQMTESMASMQATPDPTFDRFDAGNSSPVVAWLASESSGWLTGSVLRIDGGVITRVLGWQVDDSTRYDVGHARLDATKIDDALRKSYGIAPRGMPSGVVTS